MVVLVVALVLAVVSLWSVSIGAARDVRREQTKDLEAWCRAWVPLAGGQRLYRCGARPVAGSAYCPTHASPARRNAGTTHPDAPRVEATRAWADARRKMRWGVPVATASVVVTVALLVALT